MTLYIIGRWGNEQAGPDGRDTVFVVVACSYTIAARMVDRHIRQGQASPKMASVNWVCEIGLYSGPSHTEKILSGPLLELFHSCGVGYKRMWTRERPRCSWRDRTSEISGLSK